MPRKNLRDEAADVDQAVQLVKQRAQGIERDKFWIPSGSTLFNLAATGRAAGFCTTGRMVNIVGDSNAGKSMLSMTVLAATYYKYLERFRLIYDDVEQAMTFDIPKLFGQQFANALEAPSHGYGDRPVVETFLKNFKEVVAKGKPFIYVLDSWDALQSEQEMATQDKVDEGGTAGSYGMAKQKIASQRFGRIVGTLSDMDSLLIIVSQTRDNINPMSFEKKYRAGGKALKFYSSVEAWLSIEQKLGDKRDTIGVVTQLKVVRSRFSGSQRIISFPIYHVYGIDDTQSCLDYLIEEEVLKKNGAWVNFPDGQKCQSGEAAAYAEKALGRRGLRKLVAETWRKRQQEQEDKVLRGRKPKFAED